MFLQSKDAIYPWHPTEPEAESDWTEVDETFSLFDDLPEDELSLQAEEFYSNLHQHWQAIDEQLAEEFYSNLHQHWQVIDHQNVEELLQRFSTLLPPQWLDILLERAKSLVTEESIESRERLVSCVKPLLSHWSNEELQLLAQEASSKQEIQDLEEMDWEKRSPIEQARLTIAIAQEILISLESNQSTISD